jgi:hypothetical protein
MLEKVSSRPKKLRNRNSLFMTFLHTKLVEIGSSGSGSRRLDQTKKVRIRNTVGKYSTFSRLSFISMGSTWSAWVVLLECEAVHAGERTGGRTGRAVHTVAALLTAALHAVQAAT